jgi:hypothetical protein
MRIQEKAHLGVPADEAWQALIRWEDQSRWMKDADSVRVESSNREGVGVLLAVKTRVLGIPLFVERLQVSEWEPPARIVVRHGSFVRGFGEWALDSAERDECVLRWTEDLRLPIPFVGELALRCYRPFMRRLMRGSLGRLAAQLETDST